MKHIWYFSYPRARLGFIEDGGAITGIFFDKGGGNGAAPPEETPLIKRAAAQISEYFAGKRTRFDFPISPAGTGFQKNVWGIVSSIPYGETRSYKEVAVLAGNPGAARAVGMANNRNPIVIVIPCHRVTGADGSLTGYGGGLDLKEYLLNLEKQPGARVSQH
jgi:methylated-DNA-[protein]-cysteine S-methyltransferase